MDSGPGKITLCLLPRRLLEVIVEAAALGPSVSRAAPREEGELVQGKARGSLGKGRCSSVIPEVEGRFWELL